MKSNFSLRAAFAALCTAVTPAQAQLSEHELAVVEAKVLATLLTYEKYCGPLGPHSQWSQKHLSETPTSLSKAEITEIVLAAVAKWKEDSQKYCDVLRDGMEK